jgi:GT2 family glycosyltransferase
MKPVSVLVVIVNYRTARLSIDAVASLEEEVKARGDTHVVVIDNGSGDGSAEAIAGGIAERGFNDWCTLHATPRNGGFAAGNNEAIRWYLGAADGALPDFVWLLNPDTLAHPGAIGGLVDFLHANPQVGIAGGRCLWEDGKVRRAAFLFPNVRSELIAAANFGPITRLLGSREVALPPSDQPMRVDWVSGSSFMIRRTVIETIGLMDEGYFLYFEESDYCSRADAAGFEIWTTPSSVITHLGGQATGVTGPQRKNRRRPRYWFESRARFLVRRYGAGTAHLANLAFIAAYPFGRLIAAVRGMASEDPQRLWQDFVMYNYGPQGLMYRAGRMAG